jgi:alkaline phosphatase
VIVTADHECGGLKVVEPAGKGVLPKVTWSSGGHTNVRVPLYAWGAGSERFAGQLDNTDLFFRVLGRQRPGPIPTPARRRSKAKPASGKPAPPVPTPY